MRLPKKSVVLWVRTYRISLNLIPGVGWGKLPKKLVWGVGIGVLRVSVAPHRIRAGQRIMTWR